MTTDERSAVSLHRRDARPTTAAGRHRGNTSFLRELPFLLLVALGLALLIKTFLMQAFYIPSGSMENTLQVRDRVLVNKLVYRFREIHRGEIVVFNGLNSFTPEVLVVPPTNPVQRVLQPVARALGVGPPGEEDFIKRVIGIPGDTVACCDPKGRVTVNGVGLDEPYVYENNPLGSRSFLPVKVPEGRLWVMGDHRAYSADSRLHTMDPGGGTVPADKVIGRAFVKVWPPARIGLLSVPDTFHQKALSLGVVAAPYALGLVGAVPVVLLRRRRRGRRARRTARRSFGLPGSHACCFALTSDRDPGNRTAVALAARSGALDLRRRARLC